MSDGKYEKRNMNVDTSSQTVAKGWLSSSGYSQITRKSCLFTFERTYTASVKSSGIATKPNAPTLSVTAAKGDSGKITVKHTDPAGKSATVKVKATCNKKTVEVISYSNSGTIANGSSKSYTIDFTKHFGEDYRGNDITYEAWSKNTLDYTSSSSGVKGGHRYNGRPSVPKMTSVKGSSDSSILYSYIDFAWSKSTDPDDDTPLYDLHLKVTDPSGKVLKNEIIANDVSKTSYKKYDIQSFTEKSTFEVKVRATDGKLNSSWSGVMTFTKGAKPRGELAMIAPCVSNTTLYNARPRFFFEGWDGTSEFVFVYNDKEYTTTNNSSLFSKAGNTIVFKPNFDMTKDEKFSCYGYMKNEYGTSKKSSTCKFTIKNPTEDITENNIIKAANINKVYTLISNFAKAYDKTFNETVEKEQIMKADTYNVCNEFLSFVANYLNNIVNTSTFDYKYTLENVVKGQVNDDAL